MMADRIPQMRLNEPKVVDCHFVEGISIEVREEIVRLVGWIDLETTESRQPERRIVVRAAVPRRVARALLADLRRVLTRGGH